MTKKPLKPVLFILLTLWMTAVVGQAQEPAGRTFRVLFVDRAGQLPQPLFLYDGAGSMEIEVPRMNLSPVYKLRSEAARLLLLPEPVADPEQIPPGAPAVDVPAGYLDFYLLVSRDAANPVVPVRMNVVDVTGNRLARGQMLWYNLSDKAVGGTVGSERIALRPGASSVVREPHHEPGDYPVHLFFRVDGDEFMHPLTETRWRHDPRSRSLVFIFNEGTRRAPRVFAFSDFRRESE